MISRCSLLGRVGFKDIHDNIVKLSIAVDKLKKNETKTNWFKVIIFGDNKSKFVSEDAINVGDTIFVEGDLNTSEYITKDGTPKLDVSIIASTVKRIYKKKKQDNINDDIPF